ncbi:MAG: hypothetical protein K2F56_04770, partial [Anaeroplasmataceae bacterium]|nr:hypothetical protein [Anaeroplasmataceae bacterium]
VRESRLSAKSKTFLSYLRTNQMDVFTPIDISKNLGVTNRTIINWCTELSNNGFLKPILVNYRIRHYEVIKDNE